MKALIITGYTLFSMLFFLPSACHCASYGIKEIRISDVLLFIILLPGALADVLILLIIFIIDVSRETTVAYAIKKILRRKIFK